MRKYVLSACVMALVVSLVGCGDTTKTTTTTETKPNTSTTTTTTTTK